MEKIVRIDGKDVALRASGATYIRFRNMFHKDLFVELQKMSENVSEDGAMPEGAIEVLLQATYVMATQATPKLKETSFEDWLDQFSLRFSVRIKKRLKAQKKRTSNRTTHDDGALLA